MFFNLFYSSLPLIKLPAIIILLVGEAIEVIEELREFLLLKLSFVFLSDGENILIVPAFSIYLILVIFLCSFSALIFYLMLPVIFSPSKTLGLIFSKSPKALVSKFSSLLSLSVAN